MWRAHGDDSFSLIYIYIYKIETHTVDIESAQGASLPNDGPNHAANLILTPNQNRQGNGLAVVFSGAFATIGRSCRRDRQDFQDNAESTLYHIVKSYKGMKNTTYPKLLRY